jgi:hypothetical protein
MSVPSDLPNQGSSGHKPCEHKYVYQGVRYCAGETNRPGSSACNLYYAHVYFCEKCLSTQGQPIPGDYNTYSDIKFNATPGTLDQCGVPVWDRGRR